MTGYYAVIFTSLRREGDHGYDATAARMLELARQMPGFLGIDSVRGADGHGITVSYWRDEQAIGAWRRHGEHELAREQGRYSWYQQFHVRVAKVEREYASSPAPACPVSLHD